LGLGARDGSRRPAETSWFQRVVRTVTGTKEPSTAPKQRRRTSSTKKNAPKVAGRKASTTRAAAAQTAEVPADVAPVVKASAAVTPAAVTPAAVTPAAVAPADGSTGNNGSSLLAKTKRKRQPDPVADELWKLYRGQASIENRNNLVEHYKTLADHTVRRFAMRLPRRVDRGDLETAANLGLMSAIGGFDPERGVQFESYCERRIRGALLDELRSQDWLPRPWRQKVELRKRVLENLRGCRKRKPRDEEVARDMGMTLEVYGQVFGVGLPEAPTGASTSTDQNGEYFDRLEVVPDMRHAAPGEKQTREELLLLVAERLTPKESRIIFLKYWEELPMREIGEMTGLSESRVCKIHAKLIGRLRDRFSSED